MEIRTLQSFDEVAESYFDHARFRTRTVPDEEMAELVALLDDIFEELMRRPAADLTRLSIKGRAILAEYGRQHNDLVPGDVVAQFVDEFDRLLELGPPG